MCIGVSLGQARGRLSQDITGTKQRQYIEKAQGPINSRIWQVTRRVGGLLLVVSENQRAGETPAKPGNIKWQRA